MDASHDVRAVVGLGNPGKRYETTRHNVGFEVVDKLAASCGTAVSRRRFRALLGEIRLGAMKLLLVKPQTFMNDSGDAVQQAAAWHNLTVEDVLVVCDDMDLELGQLRARRKGSSGGHNGLKSIAACLGTTEFARLRIGIGRPPAQNAIDHVLDRFSRAERAAIDEATDAAAEAVRTWATDGMDACMNRFN